MYKHAPRIMPSSEAAQAAVIWSPVIITVPALAFGPLPCLGLIGSAVPINPNVKWLSNHR